MKLTSSELQKIQDALLLRVKTLIKTYEYTEASELLLLVDKIDDERRQKWREEKFGAYEELAEDALNRVKETDNIAETMFPSDEEVDPTEDFPTDYIPF